MLLKKKKMNKFYILLWLRWSIRVTLCSIGMASVLAIFFTLFIYLNQESIVAIDAVVLSALFDIFWFWFVLLWSGTLLLALFRSIKYIFNICISGYIIKLLECSTQNTIEVIGYGDLVKVWRKWFMLLIWLVATIMIFSLFFTYILSQYSSIFEWFNIFWLYTFIIISGYFSFIILIAKCKRVKVVKC